jgi:hypothetical protein
MDSVDIWSELILMDFSSYSGYREAYNMTFMTRIIVIRIMINRSVLVNKVQ